ncbi:hypothetical protein NLG97_g6754 [Lecanicillium saksenae]|uniref:Uncharacterized protein n=1 Tax=Lecanicillium saksenae TaxID=468837 RepID=A0ACC1QNR4_9HYPO|nr:hypothetical protein NLG97_g6754 [Lecanicillium saksenae]
MTDGAGPDMHDIPPPGHSNPSPASQVCEDEQGERTEATPVFVVETCKPDKPAMPVEARRSRQRKVRDTTKAPHNDFFGVAISSALGFTLQRQLNWYSRRNGARKMHLQFSPSESFHMAVLWNSMINTHGTAPCMPVA